MLKDTSSLQYNNDRKEELGCEDTKMLNLNCCVDSDGIKNQHINEITNNQCFNFNNV